MLGMGSHNNSSNSNHGVVRFSLDSAGGSPDASRTGMSLSSQQHSPTPQQKLPWSATHWTFHLQHVLRLAWQGAYNRSSNSSNNHHRWQGLCLHAACQLEQAAAKSQQQQQEPSTGRTTSRTSSSSHKQDVVVSEWIRTQWTSFAVPVKEAAAATTPNSKNMAAAQAVEAWFTVWKSLCRPSPSPWPSCWFPFCWISCSCSSHSRTASSSSSSSIDPPTPTNVQLLRLESAHLLLLLETALEAAPVSVLHQKTLDQLMASPSSSCVDNNKQG